MALRAAGLGGRGSARAFKLAASAWLLMCALDRYWWRSGCKEEEGEEDVYLPMTSDVHTACMDQDWAHEWYTATKRGLCSMGYIMPELFWARVVACFGN